jgi:hypothetical protein
VGTLLCGLQEKTTILAVGVRLMFRRLTGEPLFGDLQRHPEVIADFRESENLNSPSVNGDKPQRSCHRKSLTHSSC